MTTWKQKRQHAWVWFTRWRLIHTFGACCQASGEPYSTQRAKKQMFVVRQETEKLISMMDEDIKNDLPQEPK
jgi:hypothetical protein